MFNSSIRIKTKDLATDRWVVLGVFPLPFGTEVNKVSIDETTGAQLIYEHANLLCSEYRVVATKYYPAHQKVPQSAYVDFIDEVFEGKPAVRIAYDGETIGYLPATIAASREQFSRQKGSFVHWRSNDILVDIMLD
jgi:hypothetical protein